MSLAGRIAVSVGLLGIILALLPWDVAFAALRQLRGTLWLAILGAFVLGHLVGVAKWRAFVLAGRAQLRARDAIQCYAAGLFANLYLPSIVGGDVLRLYMAGRATGRPEAAFVGGLMDRLTDVMALGVLAGAGAVLAGSQADRTLVRLASLVLLAGLGAAGVAATVAGRWPLRRWPARLRRPVGRTMVGLRHLRRRPTIALRGLLLSLCIQTGFVLLNFLLGRGIGVAAPVEAWLLAWPLAKIVSLLPLSLGGLGVREASLATFLAPFGVPMGLGVTAALLWQAILLAGGMLGGLAWWGLSRARPLPIPQGLRRRAKVTAQGSQHA